MEQVWEPERLISCWTLDEADWRLLANKTGATRLGFALLLKFFDLEVTPTQRCLGGARLSISAI